MQQTAKKQWPGENLAAMGKWRCQGKTLAVIRKNIAGILAASICAGIVAGNPVLAEESEAAMGRYVESDITIPENETGAMVHDIVQTEDGALRIAMQGADGSFGLWDSSDGGDSWEPAAALPEEYAKLYFVDVALAMDGGGAGVVMDMNEEEYEYYLVSFDAAGAVQKLPLKAGPGLLEFSGGGQLVEMTYSGTVYLLDRSTGEVLTEYAGTAANAFGICGNEILAVGADELQRYDLATGEPISRDEVLEEVLYADGDNYAIVTSYGRKIVFAEDEQGRLYYCTSEGIFSHIMMGSVVEQIVDGSLTMLSDPSVQIMDMTVADGVFFVLYMDGQGMTGIMKLVYSEDVASMPDTTLNVYSLEENSGIRQAIIQFQKLYPDTYVDYQVGMNGEDGVTASDALRTLNTDILAGNGPDVLILDGMPVNTYVEKGVLMDLAGILEEVEAQEGLLENIAYAYQEGEAVCAVPSGFGIAAMAGDADTVNATQNLADLVEYSKETDVLAWANIAFMPEILYPSCVRSWELEDGTLDEEKLREYVTACREIYDNYMQSASEQNREWLQTYMEEAGSGLEYGLEFYGLGASFDMMNLLEENHRISFDFVTNMMTYCGLTSVNRETGNCAVKQYGAQQENVFLPYCILGILSTAQEEERAGDFVKYLLSKDGAMANDYVGFPVNEQAFEAVVYEPSFGEENTPSYSVGASDGSDMLTLEYSWPTDEELDALVDIVGELTVCADLETVQREVIVEETRGCMLGESNIDEAVGTIMQKMNLYLAE